MPDAPRAQHQQCKIPYFQSALVVRVFLHNSALLSVAISFAACIVAFATRSKEGTARHDIEQGHHHRKTRPREISTYYTYTTDRPSGGNRKYAVRSIPRTPQCSPRPRKPAPFLRFLSPPSPSHFTPLSRRIAAVNKGVPLRPGRDKGQAKGATLPL